MDFSKRPMNFQFCVMLKLLLSSSLTAASSMNSAAAQEKEDLGYVFPVIFAPCLIGISKTLERYHICNYSNLEAGQSSTDSQNSYQEYTKLKARVEVLQQSQRHILGEDLGQLNIKELEQIERQLDSSLRQIRSRRTQNMLDQLSDLQQKEQSLLEINRSLKIKLDENYVAYQPHWDTAQPQEFFQPLQCNNTMPNRYNQAPGDNIEPSTQNATGVLPGWMI
ncbi:MADS-box protein 04g005320-like isoform X2 [Nicotiana tabacum]|uniref:MADS-box protein 04g005320-like isoform X2 n=1 Tax=Nicotiana tabacum TaxID=4097 RepID=A0AC58SCY6_TOBAC